MTLKKLIKNSGILDKIESADVLMAEMVKEAQEWRKYGLEINFLRTKQNVAISKPIEDPIIVPNPEKEISNIGLDAFISSFGEKRAENRQKEQLPIKQDKNLIGCKFCQKQNKRMFFCNEQDLKSHITTFHGGYPDYVR